MLKCEVEQKFYLKISTKKPEVYLAAQEAARVERASSESFDFFLSPV